MEVVCFIRLICCFISKILCIIGDLSSGKLFSSKRVSFPFFVLYPQVQIHGTDLSYVSTSGWLTFSAHQMLSNKSLQSPLNPVLRLRSLLLILRSPMSLGRWVTIYMLWYFGLQTWCITSFLELQFCCLKIRLW